MSEALEVIKLDDGSEIKLTDLGNGATKSVVSLVSYLKRVYPHFVELYNENPCEQVEVNEILVYDEFVYLNYEEIERYFPEVYEKYYKDIASKKDIDFSNGHLIELSYIGSPCYPEGDMGWYLDEDDDSDPYEDADEDYIGEYLENNFADFAYKVIPTCVIRDMFLENGIQLNGVLNIYGIMKDTIESEKFRVFLNENIDEGITNMYILPVK